jgi:6-phosphogluconate dehydrogenase
MPGGAEEAYREVAPILEDVAARVNGEPCVTYLGPRGAGHYVKMVHNGIEYGIMQAIAEVYDVLCRAMHVPAEQIAEIFARWNQGVLSSFLVEITARILTLNDPDSGGPLVDVILDKAQQKGTGKWTSQDALDLGVPVPTITAAVDARILSAYKDERQRAGDTLAAPAALGFQGEGTAFVNALESALFATEIAAYAQGYALLRAASQEYGYHLNYGEIARIWRGGCIIRAGFLEDIRKAYADEPELPNLMLAPYFRDQLAERMADWRKIVSTGVLTGIPLPAMSSALAYYDGYRSARLPANLLQAQRDFFGAHTYERTDRAGSFHTEWETETKPV